MIVIKHRTCRDILLLRLDEPSLEGMDFAEAYLANAAMAGQRCRGASFRGANLAGSDLRGADLRETDLRGAKVRRSDLRGADLCGANLVEADLCAADLQGVDLRGADLSHAVLFDANLAGVRYDDDTRWPEGGAFIPHPPTEAAAPRLSLGERLRASRTRLSQWRAFLQPGIRRTWETSPARFSLTALTGTALIAASLGGVMGTQLAAHRAQRQVLPYPAEVAAEPDPQPQVRRRERARRSRETAPLKLTVRIASTAPTVTRPRRPLRVRQRPSAGRRWRVRLVAAHRPRVGRPALHARRLFRRRFTTGRLMARATAPVPFRRVRRHRPTESARFVRNTETRPRRPSHVRLAAYSGEPRVRQGGAGRLAAYPPPVEASPTPASSPARPGKRTVYRGTRYAWGNPGFHYGSGFDVYGMHTAREVRARPEGW